MNHLNLAIACIIAIGMSIPFGYWRYNEKKMSFWWFFAIHFTIPFIYFIRKYTGIGYALYTFPFMLAAVIFGQFIGVKINKLYRKQGKTGSNFLLKDLFQKKPAK